MTKIYLRKKDSWILYEGAALLEELSAQNIIIGERANIGVRVYIGAEAVIGERAKIGTEAVIGEGAVIGKWAKISEWAKIGAEANIGEGAYIGEWAKISTEAVIGERAVIGKWAKIGEGAKIGEWAKIGAEAAIDKRAVIGKWAYIGEGAYIGKSVKIGEGANIISMIYGHEYVANAYTDTKTGINYIRLGCFIRSVEAWEVDFENNVEEFLVGSLQWRQRRNVYEFLKKHLEIEGASGTAQGQRSMHPLPEEGPARAETPLKIIKGKRK